MLQTSLRLPGFKQHLSFVLLTNLQFRPGLMGQLTTCTSCGNEGGDGVGGSTSKMALPVLAVPRRSAALGWGLGLLDMDYLGFLVTQWLGTISEHPQRQQSLPVP